MIEATNQNHINNNKKHNKHELLNKLSGSGCENPHESVNRGLVIGVGVGVAPGGVAML